jgi:hypothetical protein
VQRQITIAHDECYFEFHELKDVKHTPLVSTWTLHSE